MRAGRGARQWRPGTARGVLHGEHGDAGHSCHRLRHPLRFRPVPPDHCAGLAARISGRVAEFRQPLGIPAAGSDLSHSFRRPCRSCRRPRARPRDPLRLDVFNTGDYLGAIAEEARAESICKFLYPNDESPAGRELRLRQEYFFVSASLQDLIKRHLASDGQLRNLPSKVAVQLNDTHPSLAVTELMRILIDLHNFRWDEAWKITVATLSYTNHTLLPEAL